MKIDYNNKKVFITGHTGFKGAWLVYMLKSLGANVCGYALEANRVSLFNILNLSDKCDHNIGDIRDQKKLKETLDSFRPDIVIHLAAQPLVLESYQDPVYTFEVNQLGTLYLLDALREMNKPCSSVIVTTDKVYKDQKKKYPYTETDELGGYDPYSASKAGCEIITASYRDSFLNPLFYEKHYQSVASARAGNVIGGGDFSANRLIPDIMASLNQDCPIVLRNPMAIRPWQHVLDALYGYLYLASKLTASPKSEELCSAWNFGPAQSDTLSVKEIVESCIKINGSGEYCFSQSEDDKKETTYLSLNISKATTLLNWQPKWNAETAVLRTMEWYQAFYKSPDSIHLLMEKQLNEFMEC